LVFGVVDLEIGSLLTSTPDPTGEKQKQTGKENHSIHGIDAQTRMMT
jgi:hypothetical protein